MKYSTFFFALYLLVLSLVPCSDMYNECNRKVETKAAISIAETHDHNNDQEDICSPFCVCSCCSIGIVSHHFTPPVIRITHPFFAPAPKISVRNSFFISNFYGNIWQPPKLLA
ncbi:hypothetical protein DBR32_11195 [Taibaiella sp. KBW10]|uniref:DUF6660 family protein n=1 Tax=Taibaiella sp. KBW10 TaxID=2153357 RepID=UPI000FB0DEF6|nr:hypothetical protein DBR32_11195 [Taibaiella sp. KBW10]